jgi:hypothetical protein
MLSELYLGVPDAEINTARFTAAQSHRDELEAGFGEALTWEPLPGRKAARIAHYRPGSIEHVDAWIEYIDWFLESRARLRGAIQGVRGTM